MHWMKQQLRVENILYLALWGTLFAAPLISLYMRSAGDPAMVFNWTELLMVWRKFALFFALFLLHNFLLAPLLVFRRKWLLYGIAFLLIVTIFTIYQCNTRPDLPPDHPIESIEAHGPHGPHGPHPDSHPPLIIGEHDIVAVVVLILMFGMNIGIKGFFHSRRDMNKLVELERANLQQQLEYLKYQLNPHFLMNTLNNIHALIDIDQEKAKEAVIELSKILRYVLYESNHDLVPMTKEIEFMRNYVLLMRLRYSDKLEFTVHNPDDGTGVLIPPMLFISFVENAFKHGVSYQNKSYIDIAGKRYKDLWGKERLQWTCRNSKHLKQDTTTVPKQGGVGMANVRKRMDLIFGDKYSLDINETEDTYEVVLDIPLGKGN